MGTAGLIIALLLAAGCILLLLACVRLRRRRLLAAGRVGLGGCACQLLAALAGALALNLYTYHRLTLEQPVAQLAFEQLGEQRFRARLVTADGTTHSYLLHGNQWRIEARVLKWHAWANLFGFDTVYRLDRLSGRFQHIEDARRQPHTAYDLAAARGLDVWHLTQRLPAWLSLADARFGSAAYLPMADGARFAVTLSQSGALVARAENTAAAKALSRW
ncbi:MAG TPA: hypothetical protein VK110_05945 [Salinisphaeraceae bacterium]|nr:hypothetical protein [Salinisphaeraceae bacterium]